jgi:hypothetical protein
LNNFNLVIVLDNVPEEERQYPIQWSLSSKLMNRIPKKINSFHPSIKQLFMQRWFDGLWCLTPLSTIFQLYRGGQFYWWRKPEYRRKPLTCNKSLTNLMA